MEHGQPSDRHQSLHYKQHIPMDEVVWPYPQLIEVQMPEYQDGVMLEPCLKELDAL